MPRIKLLDWEEAEIPLSPPYNRQVPHMAKRFTKEQEPVYRGVIMRRHKRTGELSYSYVGPYGSAAAVGGILTGAVREAVRDHDWAAETNRIRNEYNSRLPADAEAWRYQKLVGEDETEIVAVKRQMAATWEDFEDWKEV